MKKILISMFLFLFALCLIGCEGNKILPIGCIHQDFNKDNVLLMCSDGLSNMIEESSIQRIVRRNKNMEKLSERLCLLYQPLYCSAV